jgi:glycosyltransferase involved in cell wall biosynthesis
VRKVVHIITGLNQGGAEAVLYRLCSSSHQIKFEHVVISLTTRGVYADRFEGLGIKVYSLGVSRSKINLLLFWNLYKLLKNLKPNVVQTWMYHSDLIGGLISRLSGVKYIIWNIRGPLNKENTSLTTNLVAKLCALFSGYIPTLILSCSEHAKRKHLAVGYNSRKIIVIPNGYAISEDNLKSIELQMNSESRYQPVETPLIGMVARFDPYKDHNTLIEALALLQKKRISFHCLLVGEGLSWENNLIVSWINKKGIADCFTLMGLQQDVSPIFKKLDIHVLSSLDEAFPNVIAESMAWGTPCVTTNAGDAALIVGDTGWVVPVANPIALANALETAFGELGNRKWIVRQKKCIDRIYDKFSLDTMTKKYENIWNLKIV